MINLKSISKRGLFWLSFLHWTLYSILCVVAPCTTIIIRYSLVGERVTTITGVGIVVLVIFGFVGLKLMKQITAKIPIDAYPWMNTVKAILELIFKAIIPVLVLILVFLIKVNMPLALNTIMICTFMILAGFIEDAILGSSVERENYLRNKTKTMNEIDARKDKV